MMMSSISLLLVLSTCTAGVMLCTCVF